MDRQKAKLILAETKQALEVIAAKHGLALSSGRGTFDLASVGTRIKFVEAAAQEAQQAQLKDFCAYSFSKGATLTIKTRQYKVEEIKPSGVVLVSRLPDGKKFRVPEALARKLSAELAVTHPTAVKAKRPTETILNDIRRVLSGLSPENLHCDGEISRAEADRKFKALTAEKKALDAELGHVATMQEVWGNGGNVPAEA